MENIFDAHAHYDDDWFDEDREELLSSLPQKGVCGIVNASVDLKTSEIAKSFAQKYDYMYFTVGFHPENLTDMPENYLDKIADMLKHEKAVALGEIGLDYHWEIERELQHRVFEEQLKLAKDLDVPVVIHDREAHGDVM